jgi:hypothetical protein
VSVQETGFTPRFAGPSTGFSCPNECAAPSRGAYVVLGQCDPRPYGRGYLCGARGGLRNKRPHKSKPPATLWHRRGLCF